MTTKFDGIDFSKPEEVRKLLGGVSPVVQGMMEVRTAMLKAYTEAEEAVIVTFCGRNGIELPTESTGVQRRLKLVKQVELLVATVQASPTPLDANGFPLGPRIVQESWCADRRNNKTGFDKTYPRAQLVVEPDGLSFKVRIIDDPALEKKDDTDGK